MKQKYTKPEIKVEALLKEDILMISEETDNSYVNSKSIFNIFGDDDFTIEKLLQ